MKKTIAILLVLVIAGVGLFAAPATIDKTIKVTTTVPGINQMAISEAVVPLNTKTADDFNTAIGTEFTEFALEYGDSGTALTSDSAFLYTLSNSRSGYSVTMKATAMANETGNISSFINYTVNCGSADIDTSDATTAGDEVAASSEVLISTGVAEVTLTKNQITIIVDGPEFAAAAEGDYEGIITFNYVAT